MAKLNDKDSELLKNLLAEYKTIDNDKLADVQRVIINLNSIDNKTNDDYKSLRAMLKIEKDRLDNAKLIADVLARQEKIKLDAQASFTSEFFNAVQSKKVINNLNPSMTGKELLQKLIDEKFVTSNSSLKQFLNSVIDDDVKNNTPVASAEATNSTLSV